MNKLLIFVLIIGVVFTKLSTNSPCVLAQPNSPQDCYSLEAEFFQQTCCYFYGTYQDTNGTMKTGKGCLEAYRSDVSTGERKAETQKRIEAGTYWNDYPAITNIKKFSCFSEVSECEKMQPAPNEDACFASHPELTNEVCCYLESNWVEDGKTETNLKSCVDILAKDVETEEGIQKTIERIKNNSYWDGDYGYATVIDKLVCKKGTSSSSKLITNLFALALALLVF